jgi:hypothetical protein
MKEIDERKDEASRRSITESSKENDFLQTKRIDSTSQVGQNKTSDIALLQPKSQQQTLKALNEVDERDLTDRKPDSRKGTPYGTTRTLDIQPTMDLKQFVEKLKSNYYNPCLC